MLENKISLTLKNARAEKDWWKKSLHSNIAYYSDAITVQQEIIELLQERINTVKSTDTLTYSTITLPSIKNAL